jgi:FkbM family methyltransferase
MNGWKSNLPKTVRNPPIYYGQHGEDKFLDSMFGEKTHGVCVEVGAYDGVSLSNTYHFEKKGWNALCIEPIQSAYDKCKQVRKNTYQCCVGKEDKDDVEFHIFHLNDNLCAISSLEPDGRLIESHRHLLTNQSTCKSKIRTLNTLFTELNFPTEIDFISIDTENTELDVLKGLDLNKYKVKVLLIENNFDEPFCADYLKPYGYTRVHRIAVNDIFILGR